MPRTADLLPTPPLTPRIMHKRVARSTRKYGKRQKSWVLIINDLGDFDHSRIYRGKNGPPPRPGPAARPAGGLANGWHLLEVC